MRVRRRYAWIVASVTIVAAILTWIVMSTAKGDTTIVVANTDDGRRPWSCPLRMRDGIFLVEMRVGEDGSTARTRLVVDTGSDHVLIATTDCDTCSDRVRMTIPDDVPTRRIVFGSQTDDVRFVRTRLLLGDRAIRTNVGAVVRREGTSNYNVLGLSDASFLRSIRCTRFAILLDASAGRLYFHAPPARVRRREPRFDYVPLLRSSLSYYIVRVEGLGIGDTIVRESTVRAAIVDTGSNLSACGPKTFRTVVEPAMKTNADIVLLLRTTDGRRATLRITSKTYRWRGRRQGDVLIEPYEAFGREAEDESVFILGALFLQGYLLDFDNDRRQLGIWHTNESTP